MKLVIVTGLCLLATVATPHVAVADSPVAGVGVFELPKTEHWRSNFKPDGYSLDDYDGQTSGHQSHCDSKNARTLSTKKVQCDESRDPSVQQRTLTTK